MRLEPPSMGVLSIDKCDDECVPTHLRRLRSNPHFLLSSLPFVITFSVIFIVVLHRLFPALCGAGTRHHSPDGRMRKRIAAIAFSTTLGATGVLAELILCEVSDWGNSDVRRLAFRVVVSMLLICLILVIPLLELYSLVEATRAARWKAKSQFAAVTLGFGTWLWVFWTLGDRLPIRGAEMKMWLNSRTISEECLARVGVVGISLMALLSGFGSVSTPWQNFSAKPRPVTENDILRAQAGLNATVEMLGSKQIKLRHLETKMQEKKASQDSIVSKMLSSIRGDGDTKESAILATEITGLESLQISLSADLTELERRVLFQQRANSPGGRLVNTIYWFFSIYCIYRIAATTMAHMPYFHRTRDSSFSQSDPINNVLALLAAYWDPHLDRVAWSRQIGFCLSGVIIAGSLGSVLTTINIFSRAAPNVVVQAIKGDNPNLALFVSQLSAVYVLASALLLRSNLPPSMSSVITESLGAPLDPAFVDRWFDALFLAAAATTGAGILIGRRFKRWNADLAEGLGGGVSGLGGSVEQLDCLEAGTKMS